jgi:hypothetical protein
VKITFSGEYRNATAMPVARAGRNRPPAHESFHRGTLKGGAQGYVHRLKKNGCAPEISQASRGAEWRNGLSGRQRCV